MPWCRICSEAACLVLMDAKPRMSAAHRVPCRGRPAPARSSRQGRTFRARPRSTFAKLWCRTDHDLCRRMAPQPALSSWVRRDRRSLGGLAWTGHRPIPFGNDASCGATLQIGPSRTDPVGKSSSRIDPHLSSGLVRPEGDWAMAGSSARESMTEACRVLSEGTISDRPGPRAIGRPGTDEPAAEEADAKLHRRLERVPDPGSASLLDHRSFVRQTL